MTYIILGLSKSGCAVARLLKEKGKSVIITDRTPYEQNEEAKQLEDMGFSVICGEHPLSLLDGGEVTIVKNPGIPYKIPFLREAKKRNIPIVTEIEVAYQYLNSVLIGITGTNGKTTTTTLIETMLKKGEIDSKKAGNIGIPLSSVVSSPTTDAIVCELSSFQLMGTVSFSPHIAVLLNITPAHLDYHSSFEEYVSAKSRLVLNQKESDYLVYNADDPFVSEIARNAHSSLIPFSMNQPLNFGVSIKNETIMWHCEPIIHLDDVCLKGKHNLENILASIAVAKHFNLPTHCIIDTLRTFSGVKHRFQLVDTIRDVQYYNDSKATNPLASSKALDAFEKPIHWICGGLDRGNEFDEMIPYLSHVRVVYTYGETKDKLASLAKLCNKKVYVFDELHHAVEKAASLATGGEVVLLSPACASWDQFASFETRGDVFIEAVKQLK